MKIGICGGEERKWNPDQKVQAKIEQMYISNIHFKNRFLSQVTNIKAEQTSELKKQLKDRASRFIKSGYYAL